MYCPCYFAKSNENFRKFTTSGLKWYIITKKGIKWGRMEENPGFIGRKLGENAGLT